MNGLHGLRTVIGVGIDVLSLSRFEAVVHRRGWHELGKKICHSTELEGLVKLDGDGRTGEAQDTTVLSKARLRWLSSRWVVKEAAFKALSSLDSTPSTSSFHLKDFILSHTSTGRPHLEIHREALLQSSLCKDTGEAYLDSSPYPITTATMGGTWLGDRLRLIPSISHDGDLVTAIVIAGLEMDRGADLQ